MTKKELLTVVMAMTHFCSYFYGLEFRPKTDHASLLLVYKWNELSHQIAMWLGLLTEFNFLLEHRAGTKHMKVDDFSRC